MKGSKSKILNPIKMSHSNSFIIGGGEYTSTFNKNNEKISMLQFDLEITKDTIIKLKAEILNKNKEINNFKMNKDDKSLDHFYTLKVIETVLKLLDDESSQDSNIEEKKDNDSIKDNNNKDIIDENNGDKKEKESNNNNNSSNNNKLPPINNQKSQSPRGEKKESKEVSYISSLKQQIIELKESLAKKDEEIKEMKKNKNAINYSKLQNNFERNFNELTNIRKQNELMKTKIEDVTNLLFIEKEGNKSLKSKLQVFQGSFKDFQENSDKRNADLEERLSRAHEKERDCKIFHIHRMASPEYKGSRNNSNINDLSDSDRLKIAEEEITNIKNDIESARKDIENKNKEKESLNNNKSELVKKVDELKERNNNLKNEINDVNKNVKNLKNNKKNLETENKNLNSKLKKLNYDLTNEQNKITKIKTNLNKKENEIEELKKQIENLKQSQNFKDGMFVTSIGAKGKSKNEKNDGMDVNIDEELAQIEKKYKMMNEQNELDNQNKEKENNLDSKNIIDENKKKEKENENQYDDKKEEINNDYKKEEENNKNEIKEAIEQQKE